MAKSKGGGGKSRGGSRPSYPANKPSKTGASGLSTTRNMLIGKWDCYGRMSISSYFYLNPELGD